MTTPDPMAIKLVRGWSRLYTNGLPDDARERRRMELESDLWEHSHDPTESGVSLAIVGRFIRGIPADVRWRYRTLLDQRGARQRSEAMTESEYTDWWGRISAVFGSILLIIGVGMLAAGGGSDDAALPLLISGAGGVVAGGLVLGGLLRRRTDPVAGSRLVFAGAVVTFLGGFEFAAIGVVLLISGLWTGNMQLSGSPDEPELRPLARAQFDMTRHWFVWLAVAVVFFAIGWLPLIFDDPDDLSFGGYFTWALSWLAAIVSGGIGVILAGLHLVVRHRTRPI